jgi:5-methylcytosine-specific restriction endonuclease McrA
MSKKKKFNYKSKVISACRRLWLYSPVRRDVINRCKTLDGYFRCENCNGLTDKVQVDHTDPAVPTTGWDSWDGFIVRLFTEAENMKGICERCHNKKTLSEQKVRKENRAKNQPKKKSKDADTNENE